MATTKSRVMLCLTQETERQLEVLCDQFSENKSQVMRRALERLHQSLSLNTIKSENHTPQEI